MKASHIIGIVIIAVAIGIIIATAGDASSYVTFNEAQEMAENGNGNSIHVVGELTKDNSGEIIGIEPSPDKLSFSFVMVDDNQKQQRVYYNEPMPADFKRSEKVVVIGSYKDDLFIADKILMKCPSKYQEETVNAEI
ncbi:cytochrome c maturation protein CcmE domain-containing protein [Fulvivirga ligni]|uniref:cytochrome c maturation protein CcmE domain-containing protein n=1 Tax=Fulvivirga ligni TaxID=2904246 RepID=UPI001F41783E|nr:cytochrome c maturation protein CcmE [Fulvivirga ligni]UII22634.1 cytochrome c maturation protein CcmE [Fulvivirga ligni]